MNITICLWIAKNLLRVQPYPNATFILKLHIGISKIVFLDISIFALIKLGHSNLQNLLTLCFLPPNSLTSAMIFLGRLNFLKRDNLSLCAVSKIWVYNNQIISNYCGEFFIVNINFNFQFIPFILPLFDCWRFIKT